MRLKSIYNLDRYEGILKENFGKGNLNILFRAQLHLFDIINC